MVLSLASARSLPICHDFHPHIKKTMADLELLKQQIKEAMVEELMLQQSASEIGDDAVIFSPQGLGLDSVDALQLAVAVEKRFGLKMSDAETARKAMHSVTTLAAAIMASRG
jgi:acyl carrier protein